MRAPEKTTRKTSSHFLGWILWQLDWGRRDAAYSPASLAQKLHPFLERNCERPNLSDIQLEGILLRRFTAKVYSSLRALDWRHPGWIVKKVGDRYIRMFIYPPGIIERNKGCFHRFLAPVPISEAKHLLCENWTPPDNSRFLPNHLKPIDH